MPSNQTLDAFIHCVESGAHVEAIERFYCEDASMQENESAPRTGRDTLIANEAKALARVTAVRSKCIRPVFVEGDTVVIRWVFEFDYPDGRSMRLDELAYQEWRGEKIWREKFYYDPVQFQVRGRNE
jgi:ketosteroid isomerase-like protein